ncbi:hypothetical protein [Streptomyces sp. NPDC058861]|uniref:hypothetical protein n=1 Tax=Streptomyces sp. NPDC058861 TaxID=3346653 RepID=UPI0036ABBCC4
MDTLLDLRADVILLLRGWGWTEGAHHGALELHGAQWAVTSETGDSQVTAAGSARRVPFGPEVPADVIGRARQAAAGGTPVEPDPRTAALSKALAAALAERTEENLDADQDYNNAVFKVVHAIVALVRAPTAPAPGPGSWEGTS